MSKPFMFHFTAKLYTIFYSKLFPKLFLEKSKKNFATKAKTFAFML